MSLPWSLYRLGLCIVTVAAVTLMGVAPATAAEELSLVFFQGLVGAASFDEDKLRVADPTLDDSDGLSSDNLSTLPCLGIAAQYAYNRKPNHVGLDASLLYSWHSDSTSFVAGNGRARVDIDSDLWLLDLAIGVYAQTVLGEQWRLYGAAGPMMLYGEYSDDTSEEDVTVTPTVKTESSGSDSAFGVGGYAKVGLEYQVSPGALVGVAVRGIATNLEFDNAVKDGGLTGVQGFVTFTRAY